MLVVLGSPTTRHGEPTIRSVPSLQGALGPARCSDVYPHCRIQPKRHNRVLSNPHSPTPSVTPPPVQPRPAAALTNGHTYSEPGVTHGADGVVDAEKRSIALLNGRNPLQRPMSMIDTLSQLRPDHTHFYEPQIEKAPIAKPVEKPLPSPVEVQSPVSTAPTSPVKQTPSPPSASSSPSPLATPPATAIPLPASPLSQASSPKANGKAIAQTSSPVAGPSSLAPAPSERPVASPRKSANFRHIRPPTARPALPSSPLRPASMHVQTTSMLHPSP